MPSFETLLPALVVPLVAFGPIMTVHFFATLKNEPEDNPPLTRIAVFLWFPVLYWYSLEPLVAFSQPRVKVNLLPLKEHVSWGL